MEWLKLKFKNPRVQAVLLWLGIAYLKLRSLKLRFLKWIWSFAYLITLEIFLPYKLNLRWDDEAEPTSIRQLYYWNGGWQPMGKIWQWTASLHRHQDLYVSQLLTSLYEHHYWTGCWPTGTLFAIQVERKSESGYVFISQNKKVAYGRQLLNPHQLSLEEPSFDSLEIKFSTNVPILDLKSQSPETTASPHKKSTSPDKKSTSPPRRRGRSRQPRVGDAKNPSSERLDSSSESN